MKRYTTLGMGTDQGKTGNLSGLALLAAATGQSLAETAPTTFRPPFAPVSYGLLAGREHGILADPIRVTPMHDWHVAAGAVFEDVGQWKRARYYPRPGEDMNAAVRRECLVARDRGSPARRLDPGEDRGDRAGCRPVSRPDLYQPLGQSRDRRLPLRRDVP